MADLKVKQVAVKRGGGFILMSRVDFQRLSNAEKKKLISQKQVEFIDKNGENIPYIEGVKDILGQ